MNGKCILDFDPFLETQKGLAELLETDFFTSSSESPSIEPSDPADFEENSYSAADDDLGRL